MSCLNCEKQALREQVHSLVTRLTKSIDRDEHEALLCVFSGRVASSLAPSSDSRSMVAWLGALEPKGNIGFSTRQGLGSSLISDEANPGPP